MYIYIYEGERERIGYNAIGQGGKPDLYLLISGSNIAVLTQNQFDYDTLTKYSRTYGGEREHC